MVRGGGGGYFSCANNVTMDYPCMLKQGAGYLWPYVLHFIGGSYFIAGWLLIIPVQKFEIYSYR